MNISEPQKINPALWGSVEHFVHLRLDICICICIFFCASFNSLFYLCKLVALLLLATNELHFVKSVFCILVLAEN